MNTKTILIAFAAFVSGGFITWGALSASAGDPILSSDSTNMSEMTASLRSKSGDDYDKLFMTHMIAHHEAAVEMAKLSATQAKHDEIKQLSSEIIAAQESEISKMEQWQRNWGYETGSDVDHSQMTH